MALRETPLQVEQRQNLLNLPEVDREKTRVVEEIKVLEAGMTKLENLCDLLKEELTRLLTSLGGAVLSEGERLEQFPELRLSSDFPAEIWEEKYIGLHKEGIEKQAQRVQSAGENGIEEESLDLDRENLLLQEKILELETKRRAFQMVEATRNAIVERVMPRTSEVASLLLSSLTAGRYKKMKWEGKENVLSVFDERARDYQQKKVFSGGAKDQISLSLRLGFALATLPTGNNVRPRWLFLDEPLSSFDKERTQALIKLLTQGEIHRRFDQIFLVSHSEAFDPALFEYRIRMEKGAVKWSNLPLSAG